MVLTGRDCRIVEAVADFGLLTREQIAKHLQFGSVTRVNAVLLRLVRHRYLSTRVQPSVAGSRRLTYLLGPAGRALLDGALLGRTMRDPRGWLQASDLFAEHRLLVNDIRLAFEHAAHPGYVLRRWLPETNLKAQALGVIPDGYVEYEFAGKTFGCFVEADNGTESRTRWRQKVGAYNTLARAGRVAQVLGRTYFRVLVVAPSARRLENIRQEILRQTDRIFWLCTRSDVAQAGPLSPIWCRPTGVSHQSLTQP